MAVSTLGAEGASGTPDKRGGKMHGLEQGGMAMKKAWYYDTPLGKIEIAEDGQGITDLFFCRSERALQAKEEETPLLRKASEEIADYFAGRRRAFTVPLSLHRCV